MSKRAGGKVVGKQADQVMLRLPDGMRDAIAKRAAESGRAMNTEIIAAVEQYLARPDRFAEISEFIEAHRGNITKLDGLYFEVEEIAKQLDRPKIKW